MNPDIKHVDVVAGLVLRRERLLVCQRNENSAFPLKWEFPGGKVEKGESATQALQRELKEELNIEVRESTEIFCHEHNYPGIVEVRLRFFRVNQYEGEMSNFVFQQVLWVAVEELSQFDFLAGDLPFIRELVGPNGRKLLNF